MRKHHNVKRKY